MPIDAQKLRELSDKVMNSWTHNDVLILAIAMAKSTKFLADPAKWTELIQQFQSDPEINEAKLLDDIRFVNRNPFSPYSRQVESFFRTYNRSGTLGLNNPVYRELVISEETKVDVIEHEGQVLSEHLDLIRRMAKSLDDQLGIDRT